MQGRPFELWNKNSLVPLRDSQAGGKEQVSDNENLSAEWKPDSRLNFSARYTSGSPRARHVFTQQAILAFASEFFCSTIPERKERLVVVYSNYLNCFMVPTSSTSQALPSSTLV